MAHHTHILDPDAVTSPIALFKDWLREAEASEPNDPNALCLSTVNAAGMPSSRMVLLKGVDERGFVFYTNQTSRKAHDIKGNTAVCLNFHWKSLRRQVRVEGTTSPVSEEEADAYFASRSRNSQLGAWASQQSAPLATREEFEQALQDVTDQYQGQDVPRPPHWSGYRVSPDRLEFWLDMPHRLHDRTVFEQSGTSWHRYKLYP